MDLRHSFTDTVTGNKEILLECKFCNRKFIEKSFEKHTIVCERASKSKRTPFNIRVLRLREVNEKLKQSAETFNNWGGGFKTKASFSCADIKKESHPSHLKCPVCNRNFIYESGVKHIKICEENAKKKKLNTKVEIVKKMPENSLKKENITPKLNASATTKLASKHEPSPSIAVKKPPTIPKLINKNLASSTLNRPSPQILVKNKNVSTTTIRKQ